MGAAEGYSVYGITVVTMLAGVLVFTTVMIHYEVLRAIMSLLVRFRWVGRLRIALLIFGLLATHIVEIWVFAFGTIGAVRYLGLGMLYGNHSSEFLDYVYYSAMTYTTVGYGDVYPLGSLRFIAAIESLTGLMLIAWSASFTYLEMNRIWRDE